MTGIAGNSVKGLPQDGSRYREGALPDAAAERLLENADALSPAEREDSWVANAAPTKMTRAGSSSVSSRICVSPAHCRSAELCAQHSQGFPLSRRLADRATLARPPRTGEQLFAPRERSAVDAGATRATHRLVESAHESLRE